MSAAAMDDEFFHAFRSVGMSEEIAAKLAKIIPRRDEVVTKADLDAEREDRAAERETDREVFAAKSDVAGKSEVAVLQTKILVTDSAIERIDKRLDRMDARLDRTDQTIVEIKETSARTDEKINSLCMYSLPLLLSILGAIFALLTKAFCGASPHNRHFVKPPSIPSFNALESPLVAAYYSRMNFRCRQNCVTFRPEP